MIWWYIVAGGAGWAFDDFCGTPPRKGPIGPGPWWLRKILAAAGGIVMWKLAAPAVQDASLLGAVLLGGIGGVVLASIAGEVMGGRQTPGS